MPAVALAVVVLAVLVAAATDNQPHALAVAGFDVSDDLTEATVRLAGSPGVVVDGPSGRLTVSDDVVTIPLAFSDQSAEKQVMEVAVQGPSASGTLRIEYYSPKLYERIGAGLAGVVLLDTTLPRTGAVSKGPGMTDPPTPEDVSSPTKAAWAAARSSGEIPVIGEDLDQAILGLYASLANQNDPSVGTLCSESLTGIDTLHAVQAGECYVWCTGYARVTRGFLRSAGIPAREVDLRPTDRTLPNGTVVETSEAHATVEWWDGQRWAWIGPTSGVLRARGPDGAILSVAELISGLRDPATREAISFTRFDPISRAWATRSYAAEDDAFKASLARFFTPDKTLTIPARSVDFIGPVIGLLVTVAVLSLLVSALSIIRRRRLTRGPRAASS